jgi:hypothetical protein
MMTPEQFERWADSSDELRQWIDAHPEQASGAGRCLLIGCIRADYERCEGFERA